MVVDTNPISIDEMYLFKYGIFTKDVSDILCSFLCSWCLNN